MGHRIDRGGAAGASLSITALMVAGLLGLGAGRSIEHKAKAVPAVMEFAVTLGAEDGTAEVAAADPPATPPPTPPAMTSPPPPPVVTTATSLPPPTAAISIEAPAPTPAAASASTPAAAPAPIVSTASAQPSSTSAAASARRGASDGLAVIAPSGTGRSYAARVRTWLLAHKTYPKRARMRREEGVVQVAFVLDRSGRLIEGRVVSGCPSDALNTEAAAMLRRASPYPPAPGDVRGDRIEITAPIAFTLPASRT